MYFISVKEWEINLYIKTPLILQNPSIALNSGEYEGKKRTFQLTKNYIFHKICVVDRIITHNYNTFTASEIILLIPLII